MTGRRATRPLRGLTAETLAAMELGDRIGLVRVVLEDHGVRIEATEARGDHHDLRTPVRPLMRRREAIARVFYRSVTPQDVEDLDRLAQFEFFADAILIDASGTETQVAGNDRVHVVSTTDLILMIEDSGAASWHADVPVADPDRVAQRRRLADMPPLVDRIGLEAVVPLSWMTLPPPLEGAPEDLFEAVSFRIFTMPLRFGGTRLGSSSRGVRAADALLRPPSGNACALLDCKAARDGYTMGADNERALREYVQKTRGELEREGLSLPWVIIVSSDFPGSSDRHPYHQRAEALQGEGAKLVYMTADQLLEIAIQVELADLPPERRETLPWPQLFDAGFITDDDVRSFVRAIS